MKKTLSKLTAGFAVATIMAFTAAPAFAADTAGPSDVENLIGNSLNASAQLSWDAATDDTGVTGYQVHYGSTSVSAPGQSYDDFIDVGDVLTYTVTGLTNDTTYYFSVIAYDAASNESAAWAKELALTPTGSSGSVDDSDAPQVSDAIAPNKEEVKVVFSEPINLPSEDPQDAFTIENDDNFEPLIVLDAIFDEEDPTNATVILTTETQDSTATYKLTVGIDIEDKSGNPIISGTSDTAIFDGSGTDKPIADAKAPTVQSVESIDSTHIIINFDETIVLSIDPSENFVITTADGGEELQVLGVELGNNSAGVEDASAIITTAPQDAVDYEVEVVDIADGDGNLVEASPKTFTGISATPDDNGDNPTEDLIPPKDVANFLAKSILDGAQYVVTLTWEIPSTNVGDVVEQIVYMSEDNKDYSKEASLDPDATEYEVSGLNEGTYWFKITQKDEAGNESAGVIKKVILSETGPGLAGLVLVSLGLGRVVGRKKRK